MGDPSPGGSHEWVVSDFVKLSGSLEQLNGSGHYPVVHGSFRAGSV